MSARATNEWKVGAFIVGAVLLLVATLFWLGAQRFNADVAERVTYFDESVQGLEVGAPVKIRGVTIGNVTKIALAPDRRLVEVRSDIRVEAMYKMNVLDGEGGELPDDEVAPPELRVIIGSQGITGIKFLEADFFPPATPKLELSFVPPATYVPSAPSTLKSLEDAARGVGDELPFAIRDIRTLAVTLNERVAGLDTPALSEAIVGLSSELRSALDGTAEAGVGAEMTALMRDLRTTNEALGKTLESLGGEDGSIERGVRSFDLLAEDVRATLDRAEEIMVAAEIPATAEAFRVAAGSAARLADGLVPAAQTMPDVLRDLRGTLRRMDSLLALLERDPGALIRGRTAPAKNR